MEDYKEKYENALEWIKDIYLTLEGAAKEDAEHYFPELKESEDDIMRKMAIHAVYSPEAQSCIKSWGINPSDVIAWLEKQGEQKSAWSEEDIKKIELLIAIFEVNHPNGQFKVNPINTLNMEAMSTGEIVNWLKSLKERIKGE